MEAADAASRRPHTTVRLGIPFLTALLCAASLWGGANLRLRRIPGCQRAPMGQPRGGRQLGTEAVWQVATEVRVLGCQARVLSMVVRLIPNRCRGAPTAPSDVFVASLVKYY
eukprot:COSAG03_NODE_584_length_6857_cov_339.944362_7_plen_112_part_00